MLYGLIDSNKSKFEPNFKNLDKCDIAYGPNNVCNPRFVLNLRQHMIVSL